MKFGNKLGVLLLSAFAGGLLLAQTAGTVVPPLSAVLADYVQQVESESFLALYGENMKTVGDVIANMETVASNYCGGIATIAGINPAVTGCANASAAEAPFVTQLQNDFALAAASQWNPATFTNNLPANVAGYLALQKPAPPPAPAPPTQVVGNCYQVSGVNSPTGTICSPASGVSLSQLTDGQLVSQGGQLYLTHVVSGLMGKSAFFEPVTAPSN